MPQPAGPHRFEAGSVPGLGQKCVRNLRQAGGQGNVGQTPGLLPLGVPAEGKLEAALDVGVVPVAHRCEQHWHGHRVLREDRGHNPAQRAYDGGQPARRLQVQKEGIVNEVLADNAHGKPRILNELDHLPVTVSARSSEMRSM